MSDKNLKERKEGKVQCVPKIEVRRQPDKVKHSTNERGHHQNSPSSSYPPYPLAFKNHPPSLPTSLSPPTQHTKKKNRPSHARL